MSLRFASNKQDGIGVQFWGTIITARESKMLEQSYKYVLRQADLKTLEKKEKSYWWTTLPKRHPKQFNKWFVEESNDEGKATRTKKTNQAVPFRVSSLSKWISTFCIFVFFHPTMGELVSFQMYSLSKWIATFCAFLTFCPLWIIMCILKLSAQPNHWHFEQMWAYAQLLDG